MALYLTQSAPASSLGSLGCCYGRVLFYPRSPSLRRYFKWYLVVDAFPKLVIENTMFASSPEANTLSDLRAIIGSLVRSRPRRENNHEPSPWAPIITQYTNDSCSHRSSPLQSAGLPSVAHEASLPTPMVERRPRPFTSLGA